jgi:hypothetical protein
VWFNHVLSKIRENNSNWMYFTKVFVIKDFRHKKVIFEPEISRKSIKTALLIFCSLTFSSNDILVICRHSLHQTFLWSYFAQQSVKRIIKHECFRRTLSYVSRDIWMFWNFAMLKEKKELWLHKIRVWNVCILINSWAVTCCLHAL